MTTEPGPPDETQKWSDTDAPSPSQQARFPFGTLVQDRYRVLERLGSGTMGEVYRAEDLRLGQEVALKFLASSLVSDPHSRELMLNEIRVARRVTHPNVCRVHDLGEWNGQPFVSMEYVRGEDLATLLRRIGRLHGDKASQVARQICAGLQAAHEQGVLHRDLKPANILIDEQGDVRITDFGIAAAAESLDESDAVGSPAYMAPELFTGVTASVSSDVFSLGLVLYELYTGERLFGADSMTTLLKQHRQPVAPPSRIVPTIDRQVEAAIVVCLAREAKRRPMSALAVLAQMPGADPLAEAIASGQTPSPALVAAATGVSRMTPRSAAVLALVAAATFVLVAIADPSIKLLFRMPMPLSRDVLAHTAREHLEAFGVDLEATEDARGFVVSRGLLDMYEKSNLGFDGWQEVLDSRQSSLLHFWYRTTDQPGALAANNIKGRVHWDDPAHASPGMARIEIDNLGRVRSFSRVPRHDVAVAGSAEPISNSELFERAGLDFADFESTEPSRVPLVFADQRAAFVSKANDRNLRVEIARLGGKPVEIAVIDQHSPLIRNLEPGATWRFPARVGLLAIAAFMAWSSLRRRLGDNAGAVRLGVAVFGFVVAFTVLTGDHGGGWVGVGTLALKGMSHGLAIAAELALYYLALEPHVRRIWPETLVSWSRLLSGKLQDPFVAGSLLVGVVTGSVALLLTYARILLLRWTGSGEPRPALGPDYELELLSGTAPAFGALFEIAVDVTRESMMIFVALILVRLIVRNALAAALVVIAIWAFTWAGDFESTRMIQIVTWSIAVMIASLVVWTSIRFGLLSLIVGFVVFTTLFTFPASPSVAVWFADVTLIPVLLVAGIVVGALVVLCRLPR